MDAKETNVDQNASSSINIEKLENFEIIWLNKTFFYTDKHIEAKIRFQHITSYLKTFFDVDECFNHIINSDVDHIILIISLDSFDDSTILDKANELVQITFLYIMTSSLLLKNDAYSKNNRAVFINEQDLFVKLIDDVRFCTENTTKFNIFTSSIEGGKSSKDLTQQSVKFMWFQYILEILLHMPEENKAKQELIEFCRLCYANDKIEQEKINEFELNYRSEEAIRWYTRDSFLFRIINKILRSENIDYIYKLRYILVDIRIQLLELHCDYLQCLVDMELFPYVLKVYRGQLMSIRELDRLKRNVGYYISMNTFLSTSNDREVSLIFSGLGARRPQLESVLFEIDIQTDTCSLPYANIHMNSWNPDEEEILLELGAIFFIDSVTRQDDVWIIKLTLCNQNSVEIKNIYQFLPNLKSHNRLSINDFATCLGYMGESHRAAQIYANQLQLSLSPINLDTAIQYNNFATCSMMSGDTDFNSLFKCYLLCLKLIPRPLLPMLSSMCINAAFLLIISGRYKDAQIFLTKTMSMMVNEIDGILIDEMHRNKMQDFAALYMALGVIYGNQDQHEDAMNFFQSALRIFKGHLPSNSHKFGDVYLNVAIVYYKDGKYDEGIEYIQKAISIYSQSLPSDHPGLADCYHTLSAIYADNGEIFKSLKLIESTLEQRLKAEPVNHVLVGTSYLSLGYLFDKIDYNTQALVYYLKTEQIWRQYLPESHFLFAQLFCAIGRVYGDVKGDFATARTFLEKALFIELNHLKTISQDVSRMLGFIHFSLGKNYYHCGKYDEALIYYEKASNVFRRVLPKNHLDFFRLFNNIALTCQDLGNQEVAIMYYEQAIDIIHSQGSISLKTDIIADIYGNIGSLHSQNGSYKKAVEYFEKQVNTKLTVMTSESPYFITTYMNLGSACSALNEHTTALEYHSRALDIAQAVLPKYHENLASIYNNIGAVYEDQSKHEQALHYLKLSLEVKLSCMPSDHPSIATAYHNIGCIYGSTLDYDESIKAYESAVTILEKSPPNTYPGLATVYANIGWSYYKLDELNRAEDYLQQSITLLRSMYNVDDDNHFKFAFAFDTLARVKCAQGFLEEAECLCQKAFNLLLTELSPDNVEVGLSHENFGIIYNAQKKYEKALIFFHNSEMILRHINHEYSTLVRIFRETGSVFYNQTKYDRALEFYTKALVLAFKVYETKKKVIDSLKYDLDRVIDHVFVME
ncbi:unnamed protein product [Rotaria sp. Silwood2]|nr:unnamed protein product [Rotaria sp. Silwood2]